MGKLECNECHYVLIVLASISQLELRYNKRRSRSCLWNTRQDGRPSTELCLLAIKTSSNKLTVVG